MTHREAFARGAVAGVLVMLFGKVVHWFITPHPGAGTLEYTVAWLIGAGIVGGILWQASGVPGRPAESQEQASSRSPDAPPAQLREAPWTTPLPGPEQRESTPARTRHRS